MVAEIELVSISASQSLRAARMVSDDLSVVFPFGLSPYFTVFSKTCQPQRPTKTI